MTGILYSIQIGSAILLIALILLQKSSGDMGSAFGDSSFMHTRRGAERFFFILTIIVAMIFVGTSLAVVLS
jgi:protein translocase SecG subunit